MTTRTIPESAVLTAVIDLLLMRYHALILRINSGAVQPDKSRFVQFYYWQAVGMDKSRAGVSDILAILPGGLLLAIECKSPDRRRNGQPAQPSPDQARFLEAVRERGGVALVVDDVEQLVSELEKRGY